ncbi:MAG: hypothetical protein ACPG05_01865 [Bdellovibrionales bacterium]
MNYMVISPTSPKTEEQKSTDTKSPEEEKEEEQKEQIKEALAKPILIKQQKAEEEEKAKAYFSKREDLHEWQHLRSILSSDVEQQVMAVQALEKSPELAPPMALLLTSEFYFKQGKKEQAALYLLAAQFRSEFDIKRWPIVNESGISARKKEHPAYEALNLSSTLSGNLSGWIYSDKDRAKALFEKLKTWEADTPFAYLPTYDLDAEALEETDVETWHDLHQEALSSFIDEKSKIISILHP